MSLGRREQRVLRHIDQALSCTDPRMEAEFRAFSKICSGQAIPACEQIAISRNGRWRTLLQRLAHNAMLALAYAGGATWPDEPAVVHESQQARKW